MKIFIFYRELVMTLNLQVEIPIISKESQSEDYHLRVQSKKPVQVLCLEGGGIRGICALDLLSDILKRISARVDSHSIEAFQVFDFVSGASIGSLIASALLIPDPKNPQMCLYSTQKVMEILETAGSTVFNKTWQQNAATLNGMYKPKYTQEGLVQIVNEFGKGVLLKNLLKPVLFPSFTMPIGSDLSLKAFKPFFFTRETAGDLPISDVLQATTAAPTYFPPKLLNHQYYGDGGMLANDPSPFAYAEAKDLFSCGDEQIMLCLGTGQVNYSLGNIKAEEMGTLKWTPWLLSVLFQLQEQSSESLTSKLLKDRYKKIEITIDAKHEGLDDVSPSNIAYLHEATKSWIETHHDELEEFSKKLHPREIPLNKPKKVEECIVI
jgi:patatin-like phospholipase/acyl hydrolase